MTDAPLKTIVYPENGGWKTAFLVNWPFLGTCWFSGCVPFCVVGMCFTWFIQTYIDVSSISRLSRLIHEYLCQSFTNVFGAVPVYGDSTDLFQRPLVDPPLIRAAR